MGRPALGLDSRRHTGRGIASPASLYLATWPDPDERWSLDFHGMDRETFQ